VRLPDVEFISNLDDFPLEHKPVNDDPLPILSWCGSDDTRDIVMPTYDVTESTLETLGRWCFSVFCFCNLITILLLIQPSSSQVVICVVKYNHCGNSHAIYDNTYMLLSPVLIGGIWVPPTVNCLQYVVTDSTLTAVRPSQFPAPQSGTLPNFIRDPTISSDCFRRLLKTYLFARY